MPLFASGTVQFVAFEIVCGTNRLTEVCADTKNIPQLTAVENSQVRTSVNFYRTFFFHRRSQTPLIVQSTQI